MDDVFFENRNKIAKKDFEAMTMKFRPETRSSKTSFVRPNERANGLVNEMENCLAEIRAISQNKMLKIIYGDEQRG
jgi:hypothetical protein